MASVSEHYSEQVLSLLAHRTTRFASFPPYLMVQMSKFTLGDDWVPKKYGQYVTSCPYRITSLFLCP